MRGKLKVLAAATALWMSATPVLAQGVANDSGIATETQERRAEGQTNDFDWGWLGLLGLAGLLGLRRRDHDGTATRR